MNSPVRYGPLTFASDFLSARDERGETQKFSRAERILLIKFTQNPGLVLSRERLLDAVSGQGSDASDRNIDYVINRLRRKLVDSARAPTFIASQYGEGYVWIAEPVVLTGKAAGALLVVGPMHGHTENEGIADSASRFAQALSDRLDQHTASDRRVVLDQNCPSANNFVGERPRFAVELNFLEVDRHLDCAMTLKFFATGQILHVSRRRIIDAECLDEKIDRETVDAIAEQMSRAIWNAISSGSSASAVPSDEPLAVRMHDAARLLADSVPWAEGDRRLRTQLGQDPDDHRAQLMLATILHSKYITSGMILPQFDFRAQDEEEMERLVMESLPHLQDNPIFMMAAAKLLYFLGRGHRPLALQITADAFASSTAFAASFAIWGQMRMLEGEIETAARLFDQGLELCQENSSFDLYLSVLKCEAMVASGNRYAENSAKEALYEKSPECRVHLPLLLAPSVWEDILPEAHAILDRLDLTRARAILLYIHYTCGRLFRRVEHRENVMRGPGTLLVSRFGSGVVPDEVRKSVPRLFPVPERIDEPLRHQFAKLNRNYDGGAPRSQRGQVPQMKPSA